MAGVWAGSGDKEGVRIESYSDSQDFMPWAGTQGDADLGAEVNSRWLFQEAASIGLPFPQQFLTIDLVHSAVISS